MHSELPPVAYLPGVHSVHVSDVAPMVLLAFPAGHALHVEDDDTVLYLPTGHGVQILTLSILLPGEYVPV